MVEFNIIWNFDLTPQRMELNIPLKRADFNSSAIREYFLRIPIIYFMIHFVYFLCPSSNSATNSTCLSSCPGNRMSEPTEHITKRAELFGFQANSRNSSAFSREFMQVSIRNDFWTVSPNSSAGDPTFFLRQIFKAFFHHRYRVRVRVLVAIGYY